MLLPGKHHNVVDRVHIAARDVRSTYSRKDSPPPPSAVIEATRAHKAAESQSPLRYAFGDPLPGRSALDKLKKESRA